MNLFDDESSPMDNASSGETDTGYFSQEPQQESRGRSNGASFHDSLPDDLRQDPSLRRFKDPASLAKSYVALNRMMGSRIPIPGDDADENTRREFMGKLAKVPGLTTIPEADDHEGMAALWEKLGRPKSPAGYRLDHSSWPKELPYDEKGEKDFLENAHRLGLSKGQAQGLAQWYNGVAGNAFRAIQQMRENARKEAENSLRQELGPAMEQHISAARSLLREFADPTALQELEQGMGNHPALVKMLAKVGLMLQEDNALGMAGSSAPTLTADQLRENINKELLDPAYLDGGHSRHDAVVSRVNSYFRQLNDLGHDG